MRKRILSILLLLSVGLFISCSKTEEEKKIDSSVIENMTEIKFERTVLDFKLVEVGEVVQGSFIFTNEGKYPLVIYDEYGFNAVPSKRFGRDYHLKLERYLLKNVLDFTRDELIITYTEKEAGNDNGISVFAENLATMFDSDIVYEPNEVLSENKSNFVENKTPGIFSKHKDNYTVTELAKFKLCPRLYYHEMVDGQSAYNTKTQLRTYLEAILFCDLMQSHQIICHD